MLINFSVENFLSFKDKIEFSMIPSKFTKHSSHISQANPLKVLKRGIIYGANASGKTNFIKSLHSFQKMLFNGGIDILNLDHNKFRLSSNKKTTSFEITFQIHKKVYKYGIKVDSLEVRDEYFYICNTRGKKETLIFRGNWKKKKYSKKLEKEEWYKQRTHKPNSLFITKVMEDGLETQKPIGSQYFVDFYKWVMSLQIIGSRPKVNKYAFKKYFKGSEGFKNSLKTIVKKSDLGIDDIEFREIPKKIAKEKFEKAKRYGTDSKKGGILFADFTYIEYDENKEIKGYQLKAIHNGKSFSLDMESSGTVKMIKLALAFYHLETTDCVYVIDEIDSSLHPDLIEFLIRKHLTSKKKNINSQLILSMHHTSILETGSVRPDEVWFTKKDAFGVSDIYPLSIFSPRNDKNLYRAYKVGLYGGKPNLDIGE